MRIPILLALVLALAVATAVRTTAEGATEAPFSGIDTAKPVPGGGLVNCTGLTSAVPRVSETHGRFSHLGKTSGVSTVSSCNLSATGVLTIDADTVATGASGDQILFSGTLTINALTGALTGDVDIVGGTGKFEGATGSIEAVGAVDLTTGLLTDEFTGTISTPGSLN